MKHSAQEQCRITVMGLIICAVLGIAVMANADSAVLWHDPGPVESLDLNSGPGGRSRIPQSPFTFVEEEMGGTSAKILVRDARGSKWVVKFGEEVKAENFSARIAWAAGYFAEPTYFVREGQINGVGSLKRAAAFIDSSNGGRFRDARFELRNDSVVRMAPGTKWNLDKPELKDTRELAGLKILFILLSNWDLKPDNMAVVEANGKQFYAVTDWGATMGRASDITGRSKWDCSKFTEDSTYLVDSIDNGFVNFNHDGKMRQDVLRGIRIEHVDWLMQRLGKLSDAQIDAALRGSGATSEEIACFEKAFRTRLQQLRAVSKASPDDAVIRTRREVRVIRKPAKQ